MPARVKGPTDHVIVVGAGLGGLSAALRLAGAGRKVTVIERESVPGGRNGLLNKDGYAFDTGPSVLTMPSLINDALNCVGEDLKDWLELIPLTPLYRAFYADGSQIDVHANTAEMEAEIAKTISSKEALGYRRYVDFVTKLYKYEMNDFIDRNIDSPLNLLTPNLARLIALGGFRKLSPKVNQFLKDPRLQKVYSFQAMYAGVSPQQALAIYAVIAYMDSVNGVFFPKGGMHALPRALAAAAQKHGVTFKYETTVTKLEVINGRAKAVITNTGERIECDVVVMNPDLPVVWRDLLGRTLLSVKRLKYSPSCATLLVGSSKKYDHVAHHNIHFGDSQLTGKPAGDDLREGKRTVLIATTYERVTESELGELDRYFGKIDLDSDGVEKLQTIITSTGARAYVEDLIESLTSSALGALKHGEIADNGASLLKELAQLVTRRSK